MFYRFNHVSVDLQRRLTLYTVEKEEASPLAVLETFLAVVEGSVGTHQYRTLFVNKNGKLDDVIGNGDLACAFFVSSVLHMFNLIDNGVHTTVVFTTEDMLDSGWKMTDKPVPGAVVVWASKLSDTDGKTHRHIGICLDAEYAVSTDPKVRAPVKHGIKDLKLANGQQRPIEAYFVHPSLAPVGEVEYV